MRYAKILLLAVATMLYMAAWVQGGRPDTYWRRHMLDGLHRKTAQQGRNLQQTVRAYTIQERVTTSGSNDVRSGGKYGGLEQRTATTSSSAGTNLRPGVQKSTGTVEQRVASSSVTEVMRPGTGTHKSNERPSTTTSLPFAASAANQIKRTEKIKEGDK